ncbi:MAG: imidazole glycerol phosphate synthase subunit HisH [Anaerolineae bacterium]|nr:imidazole glycerol phosphate synthase subunit HisH [Anaerolineae bacterium]
MRAAVAVVDYGVGNLFSVRRALERCGACDIVVSSRPEDIENAERLILPGVGAFFDGMQGLRERALAEPVVRYARSGRPLLGICLGMQMLATESEEFGRHAGLNLIPGKVVAIPREDELGQRLKAPFIGWSPLAGAPEALIASYLKNMGANDSVYLVHSFHVRPDDDGAVLASYRYGKHEITAAIKRGNITGLQFHPEKSGEVGLQVMANFLADGR